MSCPLCGSAVGGTVIRAHGREYLDCPECGLLSMRPAFHLPAEEERARYATHQNDPGDARYRAFLDRLAIPLVERLPPGARGLDFGSGPGPTLSIMLRERGFPTRIYDPFFAPDPSALEGSYDFVTCTETAEHFFHPAREFHLLDALLRPGGWLGVMTELVQETRPFAEWYYVRDPTHVAFYRPRTMAWIAHRFGWSLELLGPTVVLFRKPDPGGERDRTS
jgi:hypothetical protein